MIYVAEAKKQVLLVKGCLDVCISHIILWDCAHCDWMLPGTSSINLMVKYSIELDIFHVESCFSQFGTFFLTFCFGCYFTRICWKYFEFVLTGQFAGDVVLRISWSQGFFAPPIPSNIEVTNLTPFPDGKDWLSSLSRLVYCNFEVCFLILQTQF